ncbi:MFS transporter [Hamadaea tsunoensis]|uniref:MFS transporter n=1 Tax=Hamadaea tsunoensis TaxID=53368 RepID=UPI00040ABF9E|nr:MFS transporter [Hamadaea tsunoensis]
MPRESAPTLSRARLATALAFLLFGTALGTWTARIPAIKHNLGLTDGRLSLALLAFAAGAITGQLLSGRLVDRLGSATVLVPAALLEGAGLVLPSLAAGLVLLCLALYVFGTIHGLLNVSMNANAVEVQQAYGRPIITSFHAVYSVGGFLGAALGGLAAHAGLSARTTFVLVGLGVAALALWSTLWIRRTPPVPRGSEQHGRVPGVFLLGVLAFCCLVGEGAAADWSSVYLRDNLLSSAGFAAAAYAAFAISMMAGRLVGDRLATDWGATTLVRLSALLAAAGLGLALLIARPWAGVVGFGLLGLGLACIAPQVFSAAANRDSAQAGRAIATVASMGYAGFVVGPVVIGAAAQFAGLRAALVVPVVLTAFVAVAAPALRTRIGTLTA